MARATAWCFALLRRARLGEGPGQSLRHLLPLYRFLQRSRAPQHKLNEVNSDRTEKT